MTPMQAIRQKCLDCCCGSKTEVRLCPSRDCTLWIFRLGHNPARAGVGRKEFNTITNSRTNFKPNEAYSDGEKEKAAVDVAIIGSGGKDQIVAPEAFEPEYIILTGNKQQQDAEFTTMRGLKRRGEIDIKANEDQGGVDNG